MITVLTATVKERADRLAEAMASVARQTFPVDAHLVGVDARRHGAPRVLNALLDAVRTDWMMVLDDDDLLDYDHVAQLAHHLADQDVVYSYCRTEGRPYVAYNQPFHPRRLMTHSVVSHTALVRTDLVRKVGGWRDDRRYDWQLWKAIYEAEGRFLAYPAVTWTYRLDGNNQSWGEVSR